MKWRTSWEHFRRRTSCDASLSEVKEEKEEDHIIEGGWHRSNQSSISFFSSRFQRHSFFQSIGRRKEENVQRFAFLQTILVSLVLSRYLSGTRLEVDEPKSNIRQRSRCVCQSIRFILSVGEHVVLSTFTPSNVHRESSTISSVDESNEENDSARQPLFHRSNLEHQIVTQSVDNERLWVTLSWGNGKLFFSSFPLVSEFYCSFLTDFCQITTDIERFAEADAVLYHLRDPIDRSEGLMKQRRPSQRFVFVLWEPPINSPDLRSYQKFFNWTMTYRSDSHVFSPYYLSNSYRWKNYTPSFDYRKEEEFRLPDGNIPVDRKKGTAAALISNVWYNHQDCQMIPLWFSAARAVRNAGKWLKSYENTSTWLFTDVADNRVHRQSTVANTLRTIITFSSPGRTVSAKIISVSALDSVRLNDEENLHHSSR